MKRRARDLEREQELIEDKINEAIDSLRLPLANDILSPCDFTIENMTHAQVQNAAIITYIGRAAIVIKAALDLNESFDEPMSESRLISELLDRISK